MAEFEIQCPHCGTPLNVPDDWVGMNVSCPSCKQAFVIHGNTPPMPQHGQPMQQPYYYGQQQFGQQSFPGQVPPPQQGPAPSGFRNVVSANRRIIMCILFSVAGLFFVFGLSRNVIDNINISRKSKLIEEFYTDMKQETSLSAVNVVIDNMRSFVYGAVIEGPSDLERALYRYGENEAMREATIKTMQIWHKAKYDRDLLVF